MNKAEILAPVGNFESLFAAVRSGADAVYFGCKDFSARRNAVNFSFEEMSEAVKYCKKNKVKSYLTVNIAIKDSEINDALNTAKQAYLCGVDGLIVSDLGLARLIHKAFPDIEIHASTQMSVNSPAALYLLKEMGFSRVVPAREMSKKELEKLCLKAKELNMEVEVFVHGALCMCLSGQCLFSSVLGGRSGNRGLCAGPCRLPFTVQNGTGYDLSLKDLSLFPFVKELEEMGVASLKIEGRMKRPEYISAAVSACRSAVDKGFIEENLQNVLESVFSRSGFTDGYYTGNTGKNMFGIRSKDDVLKSKETYAFLHNLYRSELAKIPVKIEAKIIKNEPITLKISSDEYSVCVSGDVPQEAKNAPLTKEDAENSLSKLGGTPYFAKEVFAKVDDGLFVSNKSLNELRRSAAEKLSEEYTKIPQRRIVDLSEEISDGEHNKRTEIYAKFLDINEIPDDLSGIDRIIVPLEKAGENLPDFPEIAVEIPRFTSDESYCLKMLEAAKEKGIKTAVCDTLSAIYLAKKAGLNIIGGTGLNVLNEYTASVIKEMGAGEITLSAEMLLKRADTFKVAAKKGIFAYGRLPLMCFRNCPIKNGKSCNTCDKKGFITDRTETEFPVRCRHGFSEMFNSKPVYLADKLNEIQNVDFYVLSFTVEKSREIREITDGYLHGQKNLTDYTRGLYYRDVL